jgi:hypothetical protein
MTTTTEQCDLKAKEPQDKQPNDKFEKVENLVTNILFKILIVLTFLGTALLGVKMKEFLEFLGELNKDYRLPKLSDFAILGITMPILAVSINNFNLLAF